MRSAIVRTILARDTGLLPDSQQSLDQQETVACIMQKRGQLASLTDDDECAATYQELAEHYGQLQMFGRSIAMYECSLKKADSVLARIKLAGLLVCLYGQAGFTRARELARGCPNPRTSHRWVEAFIEQLIDHKLEAIARRRCKRILEQEAPALQTIVGESDHILEVCEFIHRYAPSSLSVLLTGPTGTGKEVVARAIHACSPRKTEPFVAVDCTGLTNDLVVDHMDYKG